MIGKVLNIFNKRSFDISERDISMCDYQSMIKIGLITNGLFLNNVNSKIRFIFPFFNLCFCMLGICMMAFNVYHCIKTKNIPEMSESLAYLLVVDVMFVQQLTFLINNKKVLKLYDIIEKDFIEMKTAPDRIRKIFFDSQLVIWQLTMTWNVTAFVISFCHILKPVVEIIFQQFINDFNADDKRPFAFKIWLPNVDVYETPVYEIFLICDFMVVFHVFVIYTTYIGLIIQLVVHSMGQFNIISLNFNELFEFMDNEMMSSKLKKKVIKQKMKNIVQRHQKILEFIEQASNVLGLPILNQMVLSSFELCLSGFQISDGIDNGEFPVIFVLLFSGTVVQLFIPNAIGTKLTEKASLVGDTCYSCNWENYDIQGTIEKDIQLFLLRSSRPLEFSAMGMVTISLETFSGIMRTAGSYFTMLRQMNENA